MYLAEVGITLSRRKCMSPSLGLLKLPCPYQSPKESWETVIFYNSCVVEPWVYPTASFPLWRFEDLTEGLLLHSTVCHTADNTLTRACSLNRILGEVSSAMEDRLGAARLLNPLCFAFYIGAESILFSPSDSTSNPSHHPGTTSAVCAPHKCERLYSSARSSLCCHSWGHSGLPGGVFHRYSDAWGSHGVEPPGKEVKMEMGLPFWGSSAPLY